MLDWALRHFIISESTFATFKIQNNLTSSHTTESMGFKIIITATTTEEIIWIRRVICVQERITTWLMLFNICAHSFLSQIEKWLQNNSIKKSWGTFKCHIIYVLKHSGRKIKT